MKNHKLVIFITIVLFLIPFFWLKSGEMDLGGDSTRLYFYDPKSYIENTVLYPLLTNTAGEIQYGAYSPLPHFLLILFLKNVFNSSYVLITLFNSLKLSVGFLAMYGILKEIIAKDKNKSKQMERIELAAILGGLFYIFSRLMGANYDLALLYHNQVFLNPLMIYFLLRYLLTQHKLYLWTVLVLSFLFAPSFALISAPAFASFYPIVLVFLFLYVRLIRGVKIEIRQMISALLIFIGLNAFHLIPQLFDVLTPGSPIHGLLFSDKGTAVKDHFYGILAITQPAINILLPSVNKQLEFLSLMSPLILVVGSFFNKSRTKTMLLAGVFFLLTYFLLSARVTWVGEQLYLSLFYVPGFAMFRNFNGVFAYVYSFFYALLFGQALFLIFSRLKMSHVIFLSFSVGVILIAGAWQLIDGELVNKTHFQSNNVKKVMVMDPKYEEMLAYVKDIPTNGRILTLPFTDSTYQVVHGINNGAYVGSSPIAFLTGKTDFSGYQLIYPFSDSFWKSSKEADFDTVKKILGLLDVQYIFYNSDPLIYDTTFPGYPYSPDYVRKYMPNNQEGYKEYIKNLTSEIFFEIGTYNLYRLDESFFLPRFYIPQKATAYKDDPGLNIFAKSKAFLSKEDNSEARTIYVEQSVCADPVLQEVCVESVAGNLPRITFKKINNITYKIKVSDAKNPYTLVFLNRYHGHWKLIDTEKEREGSWSKVEKNVGAIVGKVVGIFINDRKENNVTIGTYFNNDIQEQASSINTFLTPSTFRTWGKESVAENRHFQVNGYANAWLIKPEDMGGKVDYEFILELTGQRVFYLAAPLSFFTFIGVIVWGLVFLLKKASSYIRPQRV